MGRFRSLARLFIYSALLLASGVLNGQTVQAKTGINPSQSMTELSVTECQGINSCASWKFTKGGTGALGIGKWPTGEEAILNVTKLDDSGIVITRSDLGGTKPGLTGTYTGKFQDGAVVGWYKSEFKGKTEYGPWYWVVNAASNTPLVLTVWHSDNSAPVLFTFSASSPGTRGIGTFAGHDAPIVLDRYDGATVLISADTASILGVSGSYSGHVDGNEITGTVLISDQGHHHSVTNTWHGVFGDARSGPLTYVAPPRVVVVGGIVPVLADAAIVLGFFQWAAY